MRYSRFAATALLLFALVPGASRSTAAPAAPETVAADQLAKDITAFLGRELAAHAADIHTLDPPQQRVVGALTEGEFSWGTFMRALASYSELSGERTIGGKDVPKLIGQMGLIESKAGSKAFSQMYAAMSLRAFGTDLATNPVWQSLSPSEIVAWRALLDPARFYDRAARKVINLPENYLGVAARVVTIDYQLHIITDRAYVDDVLDRAAQQFTDGKLYSDDAPPTGRYDRYSNEYARYVYEAAESVGRTDLMKALEPTLKTQMRTWWDLLSPDGYGYPWGRSLGAISYMDTMEIVAFLSLHPQVSPAPLPELAGAYAAAWRWLRADFDDKRHLLDIFRFGRGNYGYITPLREWQQTTAFLGKISGANFKFTRLVEHEHLSGIPVRPSFPDVSRFEFFRKGPRPAGVWLVRRGDLHFAVPITTGPRPGLSDYLPAPYDFTGFAPPVEQQAPTLTPYLKLSDGREIVAGDGADEIAPLPDGQGFKAVWRRWAVLGAKAGELTDPGITSEVTWKLEGNTLSRTETITASKPTDVRRWWVIVPSTCDRESLQALTSEFRSVELQCKAGSFNVATRTDWRVAAYVSVTGNSPMGRGSQGAVPLYLDMQGNDIKLEPGKPMSWTVSMQYKPGADSGTAHE